MSRKRQGPISPLKVGVGLMTGGLSLLFTGVRKKYPEVRRTTTVRYKYKFNPSSTGQGTRRDSRRSDIVIKDNMKPYIPKLSKTGWIILITLEVLFCIGGVASLEFAGGIVAMVIAYVVAIAVGINNQKAGKDYLIIGGNQIYEPPEHWDGDTSPTEEWKREHLKVTMEKVDAMEGHEFEYFVADLLEKLGYENVSVTRGSGDQGVDVLAELNGIKYAIQCKNYSSALGNTPVQEVSAGKEFYGCHVGVVVTNNYFTKGGRELAERVKVILWDRDKLAEMMDSVEDQQ